MRKPTIKVASDSTRQMTVRAIQEISCAASSVERVAVVELMVIIVRPAYPLKFKIGEGETGIGSPKKIYLQGREKQNSNSMLYGLALEQMSWTRQFQLET